MNVGPILLAGLLTTTAGAVSAQAPSAGDPVERERTRAHYAEVEDELRVCDVSHLSADQRSARAQALDLLEAYHLRAAFPVNPAYDGARVPFFRDEDGRMCGVATLIQETGHGALLERLVSEDNHRWIQEIVHDAEFQSWLAEHGLTGEEAARIHGPAIPPPRTPPGPPTPDDVGPSVTGTVPAQPVHTGAGDTPTLRPAPAEGATSARPAEAAPCASPARRPAATAAVRTSGAAVAGMPGLPPEDVTWWTWWMDNQERFLRPHRLDAETGDARYRDRLSGSRFDAAAAEVARLMREHLADGDAAVRSAAVVGLARLGSADDVAVIEALLGDASLMVRESAILALGATGDEAAVAPLLALAKGSNEVSPIARPLALVALGVGRRLGLGPATDLRVQRLLNETPGDEDLQLGALLYKELAGASNLDLRARAMAADEQLSSAVRCRALEALGGSFEDEALATLLDEVSGRDVVRRRSAAMGLAELDSGLALAPLFNAFELEGEMTTRSLILMAIGEHGGAEARQFLERTMRRGPLQQRAWAALALGLATRGANEETRHAIALSLRDGYRAEKHSFQRGAYLVGAGLTGDVSSASWMAAELAEHNVDLRCSAANGLGLLGGDAARAALCAAIDVESSQAARAIELECLAWLGDARDARCLMDGFHELTDPALRSNVAVALGMHGSAAALEGLRGIVKNPSTPSQVLAGAFEGLGLALSVQPGFVLCEVVQRANSTAFPHWLRDVTSRTL